MNKKKIKAFAGSMFVLILMAVAAFFVLTMDRRYKVTEGQILAADIGAKDLFSADMTEDEFKSAAEEAADYLQSNGINTAIVKINDGNSSVIPLDGFDYVYSNRGYLRDEDVLRQVKSALNKRKIQLYLQLDCRGLDGEKALSALQQLYKNYKISGVVIENCPREENFAARAKEVVSSADLVLLTDDRQQAQRGLSSSIFDTVICENISVDDYKTLKEENTSDSKLLLHYSSPTLNSDVFILNNFYSIDGAVLASYNGRQSQSVMLNLAFNKNENLPLFNLSVSDDFTLTYPTEDITTYYSGVYITGTGARNMSVDINGTVYPAQPDGTFGVYMELEVGDNEFTVSSGSESSTVTVTRKKYSTSSGSKIPWDDSVQLSAGRVVKTTGELTSMLSDEDDDSAIIAGLAAGTKLVVTDSVETVRSGKKTYAYKLSNGAFVLSSKVEITDEATSDYSPTEDEMEEAGAENLTDFNKPVISAAVSESYENGDELITFTVNNMPAVISSFTDSRLVLQFLDTSAEITDIPRSGFFTGCTIENKEDGAYITLQLNKDNMLWGYDVKSVDGSVQIYLKHTPHLDNSTAPLAGVTVMLDAGHGDYDSGALGVASTNGPLEKTLNLSVAKATAALLQSYGANVILTREDDTFLTLDERRNMIRELKPDIFISVHHNSMDYSYNSNNAKGSECYYFTSQSRELADLMCENISAATGRNNRGAQNGYYYVTRTDIAPSVLMEYSFIINPQEYYETYSDEDIYKAAYGTVQSVIEFIASKNEVQ